MVRVTGLILFNCIGSDSNKYDRFSDFQLLPNFQSILDQENRLTIANKPAKVSQLCSTNLL